WLIQHVPAELRTSAEHVAADLPRIVLEGKIDEPGARVSQHLEDCSHCMETSRDLISMNERMNRHTLGVAGFAALAVVLPAAAQGSFAAIGVGTAAALLVVGGATVAATLGLFGSFGPLGSAPVSEPPGTVGT